jgi:RimJ/RimL family protein N-acetyltransferase
MSEILTNGTLRMHFKSLEREDLEWLLIQRNLPNNYINFNQPTPLSYANQLSWYENEVLPKKTYAYIIYAGAIRMGYIALQNINWITRSAEVSHFIISDFSPELALYAHQLILDIAFELLNLNRVHSICFEGNPVLERIKPLGFKVEGKLRQYAFKNGKFGDAFMIAVLRSERRKIGDPISEENLKETVGKD